MESHGICWHQISTNPARHVPCNYAANCDRNELIPPTESPQAAHLMILLYYLLRFTTDFPRVAHICYVCLSEDDGSFSGSHWGSSKPRGVSGGRGRGTPSERAPDLGRGGGDSATGQGSQADKSRSVSGFTWSLKVFNCNKLFLTKFKTTFSKYNIKVCHLNLILNLTSSTM